ncbi:uncharacterized protein PFL1_03987 [Pseudozyma flocculosa PF-1]|uniref:Extracellular membrane protein CFEM domain-containing protein n=2 Tax=Pseudozyma flocculosa TaxID=84751 RepID=A0A5C3EYZ2_9BASI|nr:uncharacterized protein PFL1_03987 [Pseudozyma flocculosa PF-1]EPQ28684.1 hypothetical protein PFL1_03987 [Pseudozyma flocculosa PF-1]SPO36637.1 uncharacterized protein PSFLO_02108 [Pseudozyma flocculosa]
MRTTFPLVVVAALSLGLGLVQAQSCPQSTQDQIQTCLDTVIADEGKAPCSSSDWPCICNVQQGKVACYTPCPELEDYDDIRFNNENCNGQHGYTNAIAAGGNGGEGYKGSALTTTIPQGAGSGGQTPTASAPASASSTATASSTSSSAAPSSSSSSGSSSAGPSSSSGSPSSSAATRAPSSTTSSAAPANAATASTSLNLPVSLGLSLLSALVVGGAGAFVAAGLF